jgi:HicB family
VSRSTYPLKLPDSIKKAAQRLAKEDGVSLNQWISVAVAQKIGTVETAAEFFAHRVGESDGKKLVDFLKRAPKVTPEVNDQL